MRKRATGEKIGGTQGTGGIGSRTGKEGAKRKLREQSGCGKGVGGQRREKALIKAS